MTSWTISTCGGGRRPKSTASLSTGPAYSRLRQCHRASEGAIKSERFWASVYVRGSDHLVRGNGSKRARIASMRRPYGLDSCGRALPSLARLRHADCIEQCPLSGGGNPDDICSDRVLPTLTQLGHLTLSGPAPGVFLAPARGHGEQDEISTSRPPGHPN
jgi:hypothetical protein